MLTAIADLFLLIAIIVGSMAAVGLTFVALQWGFNHHPALTAMSLVVLFFVLVFAALVAPRLFPGCTFPAVGFLRMPCG